MIVSHFGKGRLLDDIGPEDFAELRKKMGKRWGPGTLGNFINRMRVAFEYGITAGEISGVLRRTYIQALEARLTDQKRPTTDARIAIMAGLPKSDVSALRAALRDGAPHSSGQAVSPERIGSVLTTWNTDPSFSGAYGVPMDLDLEPTPGSRRRSGTWRCFRIGSDPVRSRSWLRRPSTETGSRTASAWPERR